MQTQHCTLLTTCSMWRRSRKEPYSFVPVTAFYEAYQNTAAAQRMKEMLAKPYEAVPDAPDPLVRAATVSIKFARSLTPEHMLSLLRGRAR